MKMWRWSKAATSRICSESSIPLPNTSPDMSPTPTTVKGVGRDVVPHLAEMALDRLPGSARSDGEALVVVARRSARCEGVGEPEAVLLRDRVREVGERRGALVGRDDEVRVVAVEYADVRRVDDLAPPTRLSVRSSRPRTRIEYCSRPSSRRASRSVGGCLRTKPPFDPTGTMTAFLTICAFIRPRTSVRKSSRRSDQRMPPRATRPPRRWMPSMRGL